MAQAGLRFGLLTVALGLGMSACGGNTPPVVDVPASPSVAPMPSPSPSPTPNPLQGLAPGEGAGIGAPLFVDAFTSGPLDSERWWSTEGGGTIAFSKGLLELTVKGLNTSYPYLYTKPAAIPPNGPWAVEWAYTWSNPSSNVTFALDYFPPLQQDSPGLATPFMTANPIYDFVRFNFASSGVAVDGPAGADGKRHVVRVEGDDAGAVNVIFDGRVISQFKNQRRPLRFWVGGNPPVHGLNQAWSTLTFDYLVAGALTRPMQSLPPASPSPEVAASAP